MACPNREERILRPKELLWAGPGVHEHCVRPRGQPSEGKKMVGENRAPAFTAGGPTSASSDGSTVNRFVGRQCSLRFRESAERASPVGDGERSRSLSSFLRIRERPGCVARFRVVERYRGISLPFRFEYAGFAELPQREGPWYRCRLDDNQVRHREAASVGLAVE